MASEMQDLIKAAQDVIDERDSELDMMTCKYPRGTVAHEAWHDGVYEMWKHLAVIKAPLKLAIAAARKASEGGWIDCKQELPPNETRCMIFTTEPDFMIGTKLPGFWHAAGILWSLNDISHWQPISSPPLSVEKPNEVQK